MKTINHRKIAFLTTIISFLIGSLLFLAHIYTKSDYLVGLGIIYIAIAIVVNTYVLVTTLFQTLIDKKNRIHLIMNSVFLLLNIPIVFLYINLL